MQTRKLGVVDLEFTTVGLGTWAIGGGDWKFGWGPQDELEAVAAVHRAVELGVNWVDTAAIYGDGRSEELVGRALAEMSPKDRPLVATKCSRLMGADGAPYPNLKPDSIRAECEASLKRLRVEAIDLYQMHWPQPDEDVEAGWEAMAQLKQEGKVREIGVSNFSVTHLERIQPIHPVASLQPPYSMLQSAAEEELLPYCARAHVGVVAYSPMARGLLTGAFDAARVAALDPTDHRVRTPDFQPPRLGIHLQLVDRLRELASAADRSVAQLAIAWVLRREEVTSAIVGARSPRQIEQTAAAADWQLNPEEIAAIDAYLADHAGALAGLS